jgi:hypothetical protein
MPRPDPLPTEPIQIVVSENGQGVALYVGLELVPESVRETI